MVASDNKVHADHLSRLFAVLEQLRVGLIRLGIVLLILAIALFPLADTVLQWFQQLTGAPLAAFGIADTFLALATISLCLGSVLAMPYAAYEMLSAAACGFPDLTLRIRWLYLVISVLLFAAGIWFCLRVTLPYGCQFLLGYGSETLVPFISVRSFVSFCVIFTLGFGILFEIPLFMIVLSGFHLVRSTDMACCRRYAVILILAVSAIVTPTPDLFNLLLLAGPLFGLYEMGILGMRICERKNKSRNRNPLAINT